MRENILIISVILAIVGAVSAAGDPNVPRLLAWYEFEGDITDSSGNDRHGFQYVNVASDITYEAGKFGQAIHFNQSALATRPLVHINHAFPGITTQATIAFWMYGEQTAEAYKLVDSRDGKLSAYFMGNNYFYSHSDGFVYQTDTALAADGFAINEWHHFAVVFNDDTQKLKVYLDGNLVKNAAHNPNMAGITEFFLSSSLTDRHFNGMMDDIAIFDTELDWNEIQEIYNFGISSWIVGDLNGDLDGDIDVDMTDFAIFASHWLTNTTEIGNIPSFEVTAEKPAIYYLDLNYTRFLADAGERYDIRHVIACLQGLTNREAPRFFVGYDSDELFLDMLLEPGGLCESWDVRNMASIYEALELFTQYVNGVVLYDPDPDTGVISTSLVATTVAGVEGGLAVRKDETPGSMYNYLVNDLDGPQLPVLFDLTGKFTGSGTIWQTSTTSTGSAKCDAYIWAKEKYIDTGKCDPTVLSYTLDLWGA